MNKQEILRQVLILKHTPGIGPVKAKRILEKNSLDSISFNSEIQKKAEAELELLYRQKVQTLTLLDEAYPPLLKEIPNPPLLLYFKGELAASFPLAFVGSRQAHEYSAKACEKIIGDLAGSGTSIISGFAYGIDTLAHQNALRFGLHTIAVMGCGLDIDYPAGNMRLKEKILESGGAILSEVPLGTKPAPHYFPQRNRIISGMTLATIVLQAQLTSGSLITAKTALEQGRSVYALPGSIFNDSFSGNNALLREGALCIRQGSDLLEDFSHYQPLSPKKNKPSSPFLFDEEKIIFNLIQDKTCLDQIIAQTGMSTPKALSLLTQLLLKGVLVEEGGWYSKA